LIDEGVDGRVPCPGALGEPAEDPQTWNNLGWHDRYFGLITRWSR
jgi:hypothetical protein